MDRLAHSLLHSFDVRSNIGTFIPTSADRLRASAFVDGRTDFATGAAFSRPAAAPRHSHPQRYLFHVGFCGSTLLARLLDEPDRALVLREPNCLADLANQWRDAGAACGDAQWGESLARVRGLLFRPFARGEPILVKPSNWANRLLPALVPGPGDRALYLTMKRSAFVGAVIRGGDERIGFVARAALHFSSGDPAAEALVAQALALGGEDRLRLITLAAVAHALQLGYFRQSVALPWTRSALVEFDALRANPQTVALHAARDLGLDHNAEEIAKNCTIWASRHSKQPDRPFENDAALNRDDRAILDVVERWASQAIDAQGIF